MKNVFITGTTSGIGYETAINLAQQNCNLFLANRSEDKTKELIQHVSQVAPQSKVRYIHLELDNLQSVKHAAQEFLSFQEPLDILINNAGVLGKKGLTKDGYEIAFGTNHLGHFLLTHLLRPIIVSTPNHTNRRNKSINAVINIRGILEHFRRRQMVFLNQLFNTVQYPRHLTHHADNLCIGKEAKDCRSTRSPAA